MWCGWDCSSSSTGYSASRRLQAMRGNQAQWRRPASAGRTTRRQHDPHGQRLDRAGCAVLRSRIRKTSPEPRLARISSSMRMTMILNIRMAPSGHGGMNRRKYTRNGRAIDGASHGEGLRRMRLGSWRFCPAARRPSPCSCCCPCCWHWVAGSWTGRRQKAELQTTFAEAVCAAAGGSGRDRSADSSNRYLRCGRQRSLRRLASNTLLDNQVRDGRPGYHVLTPLRMAENAILINRGWVPLGEFRQVLPDRECPRMIMTIGGWLAQPVQSGLAAWGMRRG
jgi:hypothetical protein